jgi:hypothetical protein
VVGLVVALPSTSRAQETAEQLYFEGLEAMKSGSFERACPAIAESYRLDPLPGALFTLAECEARRGRLASSWNRFGEFLDLVEGLDEEAKSFQAERVLAARTRQRELEKDLSWLRLRVRADVPADTILEHDGEIVERERWGERIAVERGEHRLVLRSPQGEVTHVIRVLPNREYEVDFDGARDASDGAPREADRASRDAAPEEPTSTSSAWWVGGWVGVGVGAAGLATAAGVGLSLLARKDTIDDHCEAGRCDETGFAEADDIAALDVVGTTAFILGAAAATVGVSLLLVDATLTVGTDGRSAFLAHETRW